MSGSQPTTTPETLQELARSQDGAVSDAVRDALSQCLAAS
jgi:hypothetical protein